MDNTWEIGDESSLLDLLRRLNNGASVEVTYNGKVVGSFVPNDMVDEATAANAVEHMLTLDVVEPGVGFRFRDLIHEGHKY